VIKWHRNKEGEAQTEGNEMAVTIIDNTVAVTAAEIINFPIGGGKKATSNNKSLKGHSCMVRPIKDEEQLRAFIGYYKAKAEDGKISAVRDYALITFGLFSGLRNSDIIERKWGDLFYENGEWRDCVRILAKKTEKYGEFFITEPMKAVLMQYIKALGGSVNLNDYIFPTRQSDHITYRRSLQIVKEGAKACGIQVNIGTHSLRKTFGYQSMQEHKDDALFLATLMRLYGHSSERVTLAYCGVDEDNTRDLFGDVANSFAKYI
jgi:integrase